MIMLIHLGMEKRKKPWKKEAEETSEFVWEKEHDQQKGDIPTCVSGEHVTEEGQNFISATIMLTPYLWMEAAAEKEQIGQ